MWIWLLYLDLIRSKLTAILMGIVKKLRNKEMTIKTYLEAKGTWKGPAPEVHLCSLHNFILSGYFRKNMQDGITYNSVFPHSLRR